MPSTAIDQLRRQLREKFPEAHGNALRENRQEYVEFSVDSFPDGAISEIVVSASGSGLFLGEILQQIPRKQDSCDIAFIDSKDTFDPVSYLPSECSRLLWLRCSVVSDAIKATDLLLKDGNLPLVILDISSLQRKETNTIPGSSWWRLKLMVGATINRLLILSPQTLVPCAAVRLTLDASYGLQDFDLPRAELASRLRFHPERLKRVN